MISTYCGEFHLFLSIFIIYDREQEWHVVSQYVALSPNSTYYFECWVKMLNLGGGGIYHDGELNIAMEYATCK